MTTSADDSSERAFNAYTAQDYKQCKEILEQQRKVAEELKTQGAD